MRALTRSDSLAIPETDTRDEDKKSFGVARVKIHNKGVGNHSHLWDGTLNVKNRLVIVECRFCAVLNHWSMQAMPYTSSW